MRYLRAKKNIACNGTRDKNILCRSGYFNLINGYKQPFTCGKSGENYKYIGGTNINHFYELKRFDDELRMHLLKYITAVEEEIRTLVAYKFDEVNNQGKIEWYSVDAYSSIKGVQDIVKTISDSYQQVHRSRQQYIIHYFEKHKHIPTWIMLKAINFSTLIDFLDLSKDKVKKDICELYRIKKNESVDYKLLIGSLHWMRKVRNSCAHNERIYGIKRDNGRIRSPYFDLLPKSYTRDREQKLFDLVVYMRYYLPNKEYRKFVSEIKKLLMNLNLQIPVQPFNKVRADMGIKNIEHLDILIDNGKEIKYNKF